LHRPALVERDISQKAKLTGNLDRLPDCIGAEFRVWFDGLRSALAARVFNHPAIKESCNGWEFDHWHGSTFRFEIENRLAKGVRRLFFCREAGFRVCGRLPA
jgi:hypothetical protein